MSRPVKDSGIPWLGDVPKEWEVVRIGHLASRKLPKYAPDEELLSVFLDRGVIRFVDGGGKRANVTSTDLSKYQLVEPGDFVLNNQQAWRGSVGVSVYRGIISPAYLILSLRNVIDSTYANYLFRAKPLVALYEQCSHGVGSIQRNIYWEELRANKIPIPPLPEQRAIAAYLDGAVAKIDGVREKIAREVERLEAYKRSFIAEAVAGRIRGTGGRVSPRAVKPSGIPWLGDVPKEWSIKRCKYVFNTYKNIVGNHHLEFERLALTMKGVIKRSKQDSDGLQPEDFSSYQILEKGDLIFKLIDLQNVSTSRVGLSPYTGIVSPAYIALKGNGVDIRYAYYFFLMLWLCQIFNQLGNGGVRNSLPPSILLNLPILLPPLPEQRTIATMIEKRCGAIDVVIAKRKDELDRLDALKRSIIVEAVTGRKVINQGDSR